MKAKILEALKNKYKNLGFTEKAFDGVATYLEPSVKEEEGIETAIAGVEGLLKAFQGEADKLRTDKTAAEKKIAELEAKMKELGGTSKNKEPEKSDEIPEWAKQFKAEIEALKKENSDLKAETLKSERTVQIAKKAKELGIPDYLMKRVSFKDDADIDKELADYKQELVNNNLVPKEQAHEIGATEKQMKADAKSWAEGLPDK